MLPKQKEVFMEKYCMIKKTLKEQNDSCDYKDEKCGFCKYLLRFVFQYSMCCYNLERKEDKDVMPQGP
jgi:hypothetical protein